jgi:DNA-binding NtrC family response regulator
MTNHKGTVLIVEDNDLERQTLTTLLRLENYQPFAAADVASAMQFVDDDIDVVLSDLRMHGQSGVDLLRLWKARRPSTPFIFVTGVVDVAQVVEAVKLGAEDYITKPFKTSELLSRVADCIEAAHERSPYEDSMTESSPLETSGGYGDHLEVSPSATMEEIERVAIETALRRHSGNRTHAAEALGISVRTLQRKLKAWAIASP